MPYSSWANLFFSKIFATFSLVEFVIRDIARLHIAFWVWSFQTGQTRSSTIDSCHCPIPSPVCFQDSPNNYGHFAKLMLRTWKPSVHEVGSDWILTDLCWDRAYFASVVHVEHKLHVWQNFTILHGKNCSSGTKTQLISPAGSQV